MDHGENEHAAGFALVEDDMGAIFVPADSRRDLIGRPPHPGIVREKREDMDHPIPIGLGLSLTELLAAEGEDLDDVFLGAAREAKPAQSSGPVRAEARRRPSCLISSIDRP